jgi:rhomboid protease GluP
VNYQPIDGQPSPTPVSDASIRQGIPLPLARPIVTYILLGAILLVFLYEVVASGFDVVNTSMMLSNSTPAQVNAWVAQGEYWRLFSALFLHFGIMHLVFNVWALWVIGREVEALYGSARFAIIYFLSGLFGNVAF